MKHGTRPFTSKERDKLLTKLAPLAQLEAPSLVREFTSLFVLLPALVVGAGVLWSLHSFGTGYLATPGGGAVTAFAATVGVASWMISRTRKWRREDAARLEAIRRSERITTLAIDVRRAWLVPIESGWDWLLVESEEGRYALISADPEPEHRIDAPRRRLRIEMMPPDDRFIHAIHWSGEAIEEPESLAVTTGEKRQRATEVTILGFEELPEGWREQLQPPAAAASTIVSPAYFASEIDLLIEKDDLSGPEIQALLAEHLSGMHANTPAGHVHALDLDALRRPEITFWSAWEGDELVGCGALKELDPTHGEIKSMRTATAHLRRGVASAMLEHILEEARGRGYARLSLETGRGPAFEAAHALYERHGFVRCGPFGDYTDSSFSVFMTAEL